MRVIDIQQVMAELPQLIAQAAEGKSFVIAVEGTPKVKVVPLGPGKWERLQTYWVLARSD